MHSRHLMMTHAAVAVLNKMSPNLRHGTTVFVFGGYFKSIPVRPPSVGPLPPWAKETELFTKVCLLHRSGEENLFFCCIWDLGI